MKKNVIILFLCIFILTGCTKEKQQNIQEEVNITRTSNISTPIEIGSYTTTILDKTESRVHNIKIACDSLNGTVVENGQTFSFCDTLGKATKEGGYLPAATYDEDGNVVQDYGGGKCQISSTLYCVIKDIPGIVVTERHSHSKRVYYVPEGFDAAVSYGSVDLKFRNETGAKIKIDSTSDGQSVNISLKKIN